MKKYKHLEIYIASPDMLEDRKLNPPKTEDNFLISVGMLRMQTEATAGLDEKSIRDLAKEATDEYIRMLKHNKII